MYLYVNIFVFITSFATPLLARPSYFLKQRYFDLFSPKKTYTNLALKEYNLLKTGR